MWLARRDTTWRTWLWRTMALCPLLTFLLAGCGWGAPQRAATASPSATPNSLPDRVYVTFTLATSYEDALRSVTDLGLAAVFPCNGGKLPPDTVAWVPWASSGMHDLYPNYRFLWLSPTPLAASDWLTRLQKNPSVAKIDPAARTGCQQIPYGTPPPDKLAFLRPAEVGAIARVSFTAPANTYDAALYAVSNLGLRLADPCYERAHPSPPADWHPMGQEASFSAASALVVATTVNTSNHWMDQIKAVAGVSKVETPYAPAC